MTNVSNLCCPHALHPRALMFLNPMTPNHIPKLRHPLALNHNLHALMSPGCDVPIPGCHQTQYPQTSQSLASPSLMPP